MAYLHTSLVFNNRSAITGMAAELLYNGMFYACTDIGNGLPGWYQYRSSSSASLNSPFVINCTNGNGRFVLFANTTLTIRNGNPNSAITVYFAGQMCLDTSNDRLWVAASSDVGTTNWTYYAEVLEP